MQSGAVAWALSGDPLRRDTGGGCAGDKQSRAAVESAGPTGALEESLRHRRGACCQWGLAGGRRLP